MPVTLITLTVTLSQCSRTAPYYPRTHALEQTVITLAPRIFLSKIPTEKTKIQYMNVKWNLKKRKLIKREILSIFGQEMNYNLIDILHTNENLIYNIYNNSKAFQLIFLNTITNKFWVIINISFFLSFCKKNNYIYLFIYIENLHACTSKSNITLYYKNRKRIF